jgi:hypothetical protein
MVRSAVRLDISRFPFKERACMPGSTTTPDSRLARNNATRDVAFHSLECVGIRDKNDIVAQWLACTYPCRRFGRALTDAAARLGANADCYSFIAVDLHHLLLAGFSGAPTQHFQAARHCIQAQFLSARTSIPWSLVDDFMF